MDPVMVSCIGVACVGAGMIIGVWASRLDAKIAEALNDSAEALGENEKQFEKLSADYEKVHALFEPDVRECKHCEGSGEIIKDNPLMRAVARTLDEVNKK